MRRRGEKFPVREVHTRKGTFKEVLPPTQFLSFFLYQGALTRSFPRFFCTTTCVFFVGHCMHGFYLGSQGRLTRVRLCLFVADIGYAGGDGRKMKYTWWDLGKDRIG